MYRIAFILAIQFAVLSTQPLWQPLKLALFGDCGGGVCGAAATSCAAAPTLPCSPTSNEQDDAAKGCCAPFQCCFPCCCYCQQPAHFPDFAEAKDNARPSEEIKALHSIHLQAHFQPPEMG
ncbi:MAG: hypothetical protein IPN76_31865 [Saprospiraceae bacterium]|nr:hypothetical protein [Saprospiraceae bacterium]